MHEKFARKIYWICEKRDARNDESPTGQQFASRTSTGRGDESTSADEGTPDEQTCGSNNSFSSLREQRLSFFQSCEDVRLTPEWRSVFHGMTVAF
jgi:hypothetical protein